MKTPPLFQIIDGAFMNILEASVLPDRFGLCFSVLRLSFSVLRLNGFSLVKYIVEGFYIILVYAAQNIISVSFFSINRLA